VKRIQHSGMQMAPPPRASGRLRTTVRVRAPQAAAQTAIPCVRFTNHTDRMLCDEAQYLHSRRATTAAVARRRRRRRCVMHSRSVWAVKSAARCAAAGVLGRTHVLARVVATGVVFPAAVVAEVLVAACGLLAVHVRAARRAVNEHAAERTLHRAQLHTKAKPCTKVPVQPVVAYSRVEPLEPS
jgi:hypothetical protein